MEEKLKVGDRVRIVSPSWYRRTGGKTPDDDREAEVIIDEETKRGGLCFRHIKSGAHSGPVDCARIERLPSPSPEAPRTEGRWPPREGDVWHHPSSKREATFNGRTREHHVPGNPAWRLGMWSDGCDLAAVGDEAEFRKYFTFISHAIPDKPEPVREVTKLPPHVVRTPSGQYVFGECSECAAKPGSPELCAACVKLQTMFYREGGAGLRGLSLPPPRPVYVCQVSDEDCLGVPVRR